METSRRSSRAARASQPLQSASHHSSNSSNSSSRAERATRSNQKPGTPRKTTPSGSLSSEPLDDATAAEETMQTRRKRGRADEREKSSKAQPAPAEPTNVAEEGAEDEEAVRCICGLDEYPGPPQLDEDNKDSIMKGIEESVISPADVTEDLAGFFLQCDVCKVWQHGGCVGIMSEDTSPEEYFCENCRKELHKIYTAPDGQRYSHYLPLYQSLSRTTSRDASSKDGTRSPRGSKSGRPSSSLQSAKRRSTMNSRDAAYDEEEQLRRAIEASKGEKSGESTDGGTTTRRGKRGRSDSEEKPDGPKRQRTTSASPSPTREPLRSVSQADSDEGTNGKPVGAKKIRGAAARNHKEKEERDGRERLRQEAAKKRMGRAERRRVEDNENPTATDTVELLLEEPEPPEEIHIPAAPVVKTTVIKPSEVATQPLDPPSSSQVAAPDTPPSAPVPISHKKGGRPPNARKGKVGKNQYTKDRETQDQDEKSPKRSQSRDVVRNGDDSNHPTSTKASVSEARVSKLKGSGSKVSMGDMKKRVSAILGYISRTQVELASESLSPAAGAAAEKMIRGIADGLPMIKVNCEDDANGARTNGGPAAQEKEFKDLACVEMMDVLTRQLVKWQKEFTT